MCAYVNNKQRETMNDDWITNVIAYLICHSDKNTAKVPISNPVELFVDEESVVSEELPHDSSQHGNSDGKVITVRLHEVVARDRCWIDVVLAEWSQEILWNLPGVQSATSSSMGAFGVVSSLRI